MLRERNCKYSKISNPSNSRAHSRIFMRSLSQRKKKTLTTDEKNVSITRHHVLYITTFCVYVRCSHCSLLIWIRNQYSQSVINFVWNKLYATPKCPNLRLCSFEHFFFYTSLRFVNIRSNTYLKMKRKSHYNIFYVLSNGHTGQNQYKKINLKTSKFRNVKRHTNFVIYPTATRTT